MEVDSGSLAHPDTYAFLASGQSRSCLRELRAPEVRPEATLDLHGRNAAQAERELIAFVERARGQGKRLLLVVHGRGRGSGLAGPVLRQLVIDLLSAGPLCAHVLALVSAPAALGGVGAGLVWLRRAPR